MKLPGWQKIQVGLGGLRPLKSEKNAKKIDFSLITFLLLIIGNNIGNEKNKVQWEESAYQISIKSNENWQSYEFGDYEKMWKIAVFAW